MEEALIKRVLPHSVEAEQSVIGAMLMDQEAIIKASEIISGDDFYQHQYGIVFDAIVELYNDGKPVDLITLQNLLREKDVPPEISSLEFVKDLLTSALTSTNADAYAQIVHEKAVLRKLIKVNEQIANDCYSEKEKLEDILESAEKRIFDIVQKRNSGDFVPIKDVVLRALDRIEAASRNKGSVTGIPTGFIDLDYKTTGMQPSDLVLIAARPSMGKTAFVLNIAQYMAFKKNYTAAIFSLEMSKEQLVNRLFALESQVDSQQLRTGNLSDDDWAKLIEGAGIVGRSNLIIDDTPGYFRCGASLQMPQIQSRKRSGCHHDRLPAADDRKQTCRFQTAGNFRYFEILKRDCQRASGSGACTFSAEPCGRAETGSQTDAFRPARVRCDRAGCRRCNVPLSR